MMTFSPRDVLYVTELRYSGLFTYRYLELYVFDGSVIRCTSLTPGYE